MGENKTLLIVVGAILVYMLVLRRPAGVVVPAGASYLGKPIAPKPAMPQASVSQQLAAAAIKSAPSIFKSLGSFFSSDDGDDDSSAFSEDDFSSDDDE